MKIVRINNFTRDLGAPHEWPQENVSCDSLPIIDTELNAIPFMVSFWKPTKEELEYLNSGGSVQLWIAGREHPVVLVAADGFKQDEEGNISL